MSMEKDWSTSMEFVWGRYSALFYTGAGAILFIGLSILFGSFWLFLAVGFLFLFLIGIADYAQKKRAVLGNFPLMGRFRKRGRLYLKTNGIKRVKSWKLLHLNLNVLVEAEPKEIYLNLQCKCSVAYW